MKKPAAARRFNYAVLASAIASAMVVGCGGTYSGPEWMNTGLSPEDRAQALLAAMTLQQKQQQLTGATPEIVPDLPTCFGARHVTGIASLHIPTLRITNGPVGLGQNDCISASHTPNLVTLPSGDVVDVAAYTDVSSARATALPSAIAAAASFDPAVATIYGDVIGTEMNNLGLHVFEAPGVNLARLPVLGRNFEYFGEDPYLTGTMAVSEVQAIQAKGLIGMAKHFVGNEQETNRMTIREDIDRQVLREIYLLPFEMAVKDGKTRSIMCAYNYVNDAQSCENRELLTDILRTDWGYTGYVQSDFFAVKTTTGPMLAGMDHLMPTPAQWAPSLLNQALASGQIKVSDIDTALLRRYTKMFEAGIFDRPLAQTPIDYAAGGAKARDLGVQSAVLLQNNGALPFAAKVQNVVVIGKASQVYAQQAVAGGVVVGKSMGAGGGSSDVVPSYTVAPVEGIKNALAGANNTTATVKLILVNDANTGATLDGATVTFDQAMAAAAAADAVIVMAGTISEEGADRASFADKTGVTRTAIGDGLDWYVAKPNTIASADKSNAAGNSQTVAMIQAVMAAAPNMKAKTALVLKDNAGLAMDRSLVGSNGPSILEAWFPGQEDGNIVADLLFGKKNPSGKLPVTFPYAGSGFLDSLTKQQFPGVLGSDGLQRVTYKEQLNIGYRWYDANASGSCAAAGDGSNPCVAFPFGHGLSYTTFSASTPSLTASDGKYDVKVTVTNTGARSGAEVVQVYLAVPSLPGAVGDRTGLPVVQPPKRLVGFQKVALTAGGSQQVTITIDPAASNHPLGTWDQGGKKWVTPAGKYTVYVGRSSSLKDLVQAGTFTQY